MDSEYTVGGAIVAAGTAAAAFVRKWMSQATQARLAAARADTEAKLEVARTFEKVVEIQRADNVRVVETMIAQARVDAQVMAAISELRKALDAGIEARRRDGDQLAAEVRELARRVDTLADKLSNYEEFKKQAVYRPRS